jgi:hypothetical protein
MTRIIVRNQDLSSSGIWGGYALVAANILPFGIHSFLEGIGFRTDLRLRQSLHVIAQHQLLGIGMEVHLLVHPVGHRVAVQVMLELVRSYVSGTKPCR